MPSEKEKMAAAKTLCAHDGEAWHRLDDDGIAYYAEQAMVALSAAEKEREGERACAICGKPGESSCTSPCAREGNIIEKLRAFLDLKTEEEAWTDGDVGWNDALEAVRAFLNDLQEQSTEREG